MPADPDKLDPVPPRDALNEKPRTAFADFLAARMQLTAFEAREFGILLARKGAMAAIILGCGSVAYLLFLAGLIGLLSATTDMFSWYGVTLVLALLHVIPVLITIAVIRRPMPRLFPDTRSEISKDLEWLERFKKKPKSPN